MASGVVDMVEEEIGDGNGRAWFKRKPSSLSMRICIRNYEKKKEEIITVNIWKSYMYTPVEETNIEAILAVTNTTELVVEIRPEKNSGPCGI